MEKNYKIGKIYYSKTVDGFGNVYIHFTKECNGLHEDISSESDEARQAIKEILNLKNGYESKAIEV